MHTRTARVLTLAVALSGWAPSLRAAAVGPPESSIRSSSSSGSTDSTRISSRAGCRPGNCRTWRSSPARAECPRSARRTRRNRRPPGHPSRPASTPESTTSTTSSSATRRPTFLIWGWCGGEPAKFLFDYIPIAKPKILPLRGGTSFWVTAGREGVRTSVLTVPVTFPPEDVPNGELLSGLPLPDIRGTMGTFYYFATDLSRYEEGNTEFGGILKRLVVDNDVAQHRAHRPAKPGRAAADRRRFARKGLDVTRRGPGRDGGTPGARGRADAVHDSVEPGRRRPQPSKLKANRSCSRRRRSAGGSISISASTSSCGCTGWRSCGS